MKVCIILGTRPEIIKMAPVITGCRERGLDFFVVHTGQHYSRNLDAVFFEELQVPSPKYQLGSGSGTHAEETGRMLMAIEEVLVSERPDMVLVEGDTNTVLAGALAAVKLHIGVGHVEAGLRSHDRRMPEEINRVLVDHVSTRLYAPTKDARENLLREGIPGEKILVTGNTIVDAVEMFAPLARERSSIMRDMDLDEKGYFLLTMHRPENVDDEGRLREILRGMDMVLERSGTDIVFPVHPRTANRIREFGAGNAARETGRMRLIEPVGYFDFLALEMNSSVILTDSGGVQEEGCILGVPCVTLRENTERPETLAVGSNVLAGYRAEDIADCVETMTGRTGGWENPFGDGRAGMRVVESLIDT